MAPDPANGGKPPHSPIPAIQFSGADIPVCEENILSGGADIPVCALSGLAPAKERPNNPEGVAQPVILPRH